MLLAALLIEYSRDNKVDETVHAFGVLVEAGTRRQDGDTQLRQLQLALQMNGRHRRLAGHEDQLSSLLDGDVGSALDQIVAGALGNRRNGATARRDRKSVGEGRSN